MSGVACGGWGCGSGGGTGWDSGGGWSGSGSSGFKLPSDEDNEKTATMIGGVNGADEDELKMALNKDLGITGSAEVKDEQLKGFLTNLGFSDADAKKIADGIDDKFPDLTGDDLLEKILFYDENGDGQMSAEEFEAHNEDVAKLGKSGGWS